MVTRFAFANTIPVENYEEKHLSKQLKDGAEGIYMCQVDPAGFY